MNVNASAVDFDHANIAHKVRKIREYGVDNPYFEVYNRIKLQEGELTMYRYCFNEVDNKSGNGMDNRTIGLALSYSFLR